MFAHFLVFLHEQFYLVRTHRNYNNRAVVYKR